MQAIEMKLNMIPLAIYHNDTCLDAKASETLYELGIAAGEVQFEVHMPRAV